MPKKGGVRVTDIDIIIIIIIIIYIYIWTIWSKGMMKIYED